MGKFRKMLAGVLSAAMVLSTMTVTAFAEDTNKMPTIDTTTTKTGSITIHKYEYNGNSITKVQEKQQTKAMYQVMQNLLKGQDLQFIR